MGRADMTKIRLIVAITIIGLSGLSAGFAAAQDLGQRLQNALARDAVVPISATASLMSDEIIPEFYELRQYAPAWSDKRAVEALFTELYAGLDHGFKPSDFKLDELQTLYAAAQAGSSDAELSFELLATNAAITLVHHLYFGKVDPKALDSDWNFAQPVIASDPAVVLNQYLMGEGFEALINLVELKSIQYQSLLQALQDYESIRRAGGWPTVPDSVVLKPGMIDPSVASLRQRLAAENALSQTIIPQFTSSDAAENPINPLWVYDTSLQRDVEAFQTRHGLNADGAIGPKTFASLNQPVEDRIEKLRLSLERGRWLLRGLDDEFILVNIAGARTYLVKPDGTLWATRSITGTQYRKTPVFRDEIKYMEFNPTWTVPASIFRADKLPKIREDIGYLERNGYDVRTQDGSIIPAGSVDWSLETPNVTLVQRPGSNNALGAVKFMFPNEYAVYLHDTNDRTLFDRNERNLSSGCVRIEYPFELVSLLMESDPEWSRAKMTDILNSGQTTRVNLPKPVPVLLTYWTAWVEDGDVHFREDPYDRDDAVLSALNR